jgi:hypothetical protein
LGTNKLLKISLQIKRRALKKKEILIINKLGRKLRF